MSPDGGPEKPGEEEKLYKEVSEESFTSSVKKNFTVQPESDGLRFDGNCPRCGHLMTNRWFNAIYRGRHTQGAVSIKADIPMVCTCRTHHPETPEGCIGCGAYWVVGVE